MNYPTYEDQELILMAKRVQQQLLDEGKTDSARVVDALLARLDDTDSPDCEPLKILDTDGTLFGIVVGMNLETDEIEIDTDPDNPGTRTGLVVSASQLLPTDEPFTMKLADPLDKPETMRSGLKFDSGKLDWSLLPAEAMDDVIRVLMHGAQKYSRDNWRYVEDGYNRYLAAAYRHITAIHKGEDIDPESGLPHAAHAICCLLFIGYFAPETGETND